ncbi:MAG: glycosyltransferase [Eubacteriaceae bacterium]|nr:glycosyltransferase [Eubacteriaceae bacterium]
MLTILNNLNIVILMLLVVIAAYLALEVFRLKANFLISAKYWLLAYAYFYVLVPSLLIETTNRIQAWHFDLDTMVSTKIGSIYFILVLFLITFFHKKDQEIEATENLTLKKVSSTAISVLWWTILVYSVFATVMVLIYFLNAESMDRVTSGQILDQFLTAYKLKSLIFLSMTIGTIKYWEKNKLVYFLPMLIISASDLAAGGRTLAFFAILAIYLNMAIKNRKLYGRKIAILMLVLLVSVTASRMGKQRVDPYMSDFGNFVYQSLGEFVQPLNTFAYSLQHDFVAQKPSEELVVNSVQGLLPGFVKVKLNLTGAAPGAMIAEEIARGYGLGFNIMAEAYYYGGWILFFFYPILLALSAIKFNELLLKLKFPGFVCLLYYLIYTRLFFREGWVTYLFIPIYLFLIYGSISLYWYKSEVLTLRERKVGFKMKIKEMKATLKSTLKGNKKYLEIYNAIFARPIKNVNSRKFGKKALLSYSVYPFRKKNRNLIHPNFVESYKLNQILDELGYEVDIYNNIYEGKIDYAAYDLIIGEGVPISNYFLNKPDKEVKTIYYSTGSHPIFQNTRSYERLIDFYHKSGKWVQPSSRIVESKWFLGSSLSDSFIIIGNEITRESFAPYTGSSSLFTINPPFYSRVGDLDFSKKDKKKFLWFGSYGLLHKGLDVVMETFLENEALELHICGYTQGEPEFMAFYQERLQAAKNITVHGFISIEGEVFKELMETCSFVILTSVAEGLATAVVTAMGNGGLIPVVTKETGIDLNLGIGVEHNDVASLKNALESSQRLSEVEILEKTIFNIKYVQENFSEKCFEENLRRILFKLHEQGEKV